jgi:uncharacterized protein (TIGR02594 family)
MGFGIKARFTVQCRAWRDLTGVWHFLRSEHGVDFGFPFPKIFYESYKLDALSWMTAAVGELGVRRFPIGQTNPRIVEYNFHTNLRGYDDKIPWCSSFVNWCFAQSSIAGTRSALARSWLEWGVPLKNPVPGCIAVLSRDDPNSWKGHVGFFLRIEKDFVFLLGGNQLEEVRVHCYPVTEVLSYRWPDSVREERRGVATQSTVEFLRP